MRIALRVQCAGLCYYGRDTRAAKHFREIFQDERGSMTEILGQEFMNSFKEYLPCLRDYLERLREEFTRGIFSNKRDFNQFYL